MGFHLFHGAYSIVVIINQDYMLFHRDSFGSYFFDQYLLFFSICKIGGLSCVISGVERRLRLTRRGCARHPLFTCGGKRSFRILFIDK
jgi:hypothetical protein